MNIDASHSPFYIPHHSDGVLYAAIDLGTNNCRLMIAEATPEQGIRVIGTFSRLVRLGEGMSETGALSERAMERTIEALQACVQRLVYYNIKQLRCIATAACREASNGESFLENVKVQTGLSFDVLTTDREAYYAALSCYPLANAKTAHTLVLDIGGGSTEVVGLGRQQPNIEHTLTMQAWHSLPIGVVSLSEHFDDAEHNRNYPAMMAYVQQFMSREPFFHAHWDEPFEMIGTSGTVTMLAGIYMNLPRYSKRRVDGFRFDTQKVRTLIQELRGMTRSERATLGCIGTQRVDLILSGCAILETVLDAFPINSIFVADRGLREGVLYEMMYGFALPH